MEATPVRLVCNRGQTFRLSFSLVDDVSKSPMDLTGAQVYLRARDRSGVVIPAFSLSLGSGLTYDSVTGKVSGALSGEQTALIDDLPFVEFVLVVVWASGESDRLVEGTIRIGTKWVVQDVSET